MKPSLALVLVEVLVDQRDGNQCRAAGTLDEPRLRGRKLSTGRRRRVLALARRHRRPREGAPEARAKLAVTGSATIAFLNHML